jgi:succinoglycan biosynthesis protein ExoM
MNDKTLINSHSTFVAICVCTRKRKEGLKRLLESIEKLEVPCGTKVKIVVVENDSDNLSEYLVNDLSAKSRFEMNYHMEPRKGLVYARNKSVLEAGKVDFICFTDDDEIVEFNWLKELLKCQAEFDADGVAGPTWPYFQGEVISYIKEFHRPDNYPYGTKVESAFTGNLLLRKNALDQLQGPFDLRLNFSGGEDCFLTKEITDRGGIIRFNPDAIAHEFVSDDRTTFKFIVKRTFRTSNTRLFINSLLHPDFKKTNVIPRLIMRLGYGIIITIPFLVFGGADKMKGIIKIINAIGGFAFIFGMRSQFYSNRN